MHSEDQETRIHVFKILFYRIIHNKQLDKLLVFKRIQYRMYLENFMCLELLLLSVRPPQILNSVSNIDFIGKRVFLTRLRIYQIIKLDIRLLQEQKIKLNPCIPHQNVKLYQLIL